MNWSQFKDPVSHKCLAGTAETSWSLTQKAAGSRHFTIMTNIFTTRNKVMLQGDVFTPVCHSVDRGEACVVGGVCGWGACVAGGHAWQGVHGGGSVCGRGHA